LISAICAALKRLTMERLSGAMADNGKCSPYTTAKSSAQLVALGPAC